MLIYIGTSGYSYADWRGPFYPQGMAEKDFLAFYAGEFPFTELNFTYYQMPKARILSNLARKAPAGFLFTVKAHQSLTHSRDGGKEGFAAFREALQPLVADGRLGAVLFQFPYSFHWKKGSADYLKQVREGMGDLPVVVEFRHPSWAAEEAAALLARESLSPAAIDGPSDAGMLKTLLQPVGPVGYLRFHGRNSAKWWVHEHAHERYDYLYSKEELAEWLPGIFALSNHLGVLFVAFNNHFLSKAVLNARMFRDMLTEKDLSPVPPPGGQQTRLPIL